jgi:hypothetical protein
MEVSGQLHSSGEEPQVSIGYDVGWSLEQVVDAPTSIIYYYILYYTI